MSDFSTIILILLTSTIRMSTPITLAAIGGAFSARTGTMALGLEGVLFFLAGALFPIGMLFPLFAAKMLGTGDIKLIFLHFLL